MKTDATRGFVQTVFRSVLQGCDTGGADVQVGVMDTFRYDDEGGLEHPCGVITSDQGEGGKQTGHGRHRRLRKYYGR